MPASYSFDVVSDFDRQELVNVIDQIQREVSQRYDLKDSKTEITLEAEEIILVTASDMPLKAVGDILLQKATKRNLSLKIFDFQDPITSAGNRLKQNVVLKKGLNQEMAKKLGKAIRDQLKKISVSIQGDSLRVTGKSRDELQLAIGILKEQEENLEIPLQFENYR